MQTSDVIAALTRLGYRGTIDEPKLDSLVNGADLSPEFTSLIAWLSEFLQENLNLEERVHPIQGPEDAAGFCMEVSGLLRELVCPYSFLVEGPASQRFVSRESRLALLSYLISESQAALMLKIDQAANQKEPEESETAANLRKVLMILGLSKPPPNISSAQLFAKVEQKVKEALQKSPNQVGDPLLNLQLNEKQWRLLAEIYSDLVKDYEVRRQVLIKRLDVTIFSFTWSNRIKDKIDLTTKVFRPLRDSLQARPEVKISHVLAARQDLAVMEKTSSANVRQKTRTELNRMLIGQVPDRGGRTREHQPPPPEMPGWQKRQPLGTSSSRGRLPRVQGGWNQNRNNDWDNVGGAQEQRGSSGWRGRGGRGGRGRGGY